MYFSIWKKQPYGSLFSSADVRNQEGGQGIKWKARASDKLVAQIFQIILRELSVFISVKVLSSFAEFPDFINVSLLKKVLSRQENQKKN